ncbi:hypothetical protein GQ53DRAFT_781547 [Thozetella sp. PMI_491]|nr:hypothetical protein GQ53DRAFT_781547 [Thozetella sp. PMI_491]
MAILAASTSEPSVALRQRSDLLSIFGPLVRVAPRFQQAVSSAVYLAIVRSYLVASILTASLLVASKFTITNTLRLASFLAAHSLALAKFVSWKVWDSKSCRRLRKKVQFEFFVLILGPGGNALILMLFWPGWIVAIAAIWALWSWTG